MRRGGLLIALVMVTGLCSVAPAQGAVTIGSSLAGNPMDNTNCGVPCTTANLALNPAFQAAGGLTSPIDGVVTSYTVKSGSNGPGIALRILRPGTGLTYTGVGTSESITVGTGITGPVATALAIKAGDTVGLDNTGDRLVLFGNAGATQVYWNMPLLADGAPRAGVSGGAFETMVQAVIQPDVDCDKLGDETLDGTIRQGCMVKVLSGAAAKGTLNLQVQCPLVTQNCDNNTVTLATATAVKLGKSKAAASAKKKKKKKPKAAVIPIGTVTASVPAGQTMTVPLTLTGNANALFRQRTSVAVSATITGSGKTLIEPFTATSSNPKPKKKKKKKKK